MVDPRSGLLVDLGANEGEWTASVLRVFPELDVVAAEPGREPLSVLESRFAGYSNVTVDPRAVTDAVGTATFQRTRASVFASLLPPRASLQDLYPESPTEVIETVEVETVTLDQLVGERPVSVLKLDVQGGELAVLSGGSDVLGRTAAILVEVLFVPHYEGHDVPGRSRGDDRTRLHPHGPLATFSCRRGPGSMGGRLLCQVADSVSTRSATNRFGHLPTPTLGSSSFATISSVCP